MSTEIRPYLMEANKTTTYTVAGGATVGLSNADAGATSQTNFKTTTDGGSFYFGMGSIANTAFAGAGFAYTDAARPFQIWTNNLKRVEVSGTAANGGNFTFTQGVNTGSSPTALTVTGGAHTTLAKNTEASDANFNFNRTVQFATVDTSFFLQRAIQISAPTYGFVGASTITQAVTLELAGAPLAGANATLTYTTALKLAGWAANGGSNSNMAIEPPGIATSFGNMTQLSGLSYGKAISVSLGDQTANLTNLYGVELGAVTYTSTTNTRTVTGTIATHYIAGAPIASTNVTFSNLALSLFVDSGASRFDGAIIGSQGTDIASGTTIVIPTDGNVFELTGTTAVTLITKTNYQDGHTITLIANENVTITNGTATSGSDITIKLAGAANYSMTADDTLTLCLCSTTAGAQAWREVSRSVN